MTIANCKLKIGRHAFARSFVNLQLAICNGRFAIVLATLLALAFSGCSLARTATVGLPARHTVRAEQLLVLSDFALESTHPLIQDLVVLRKQVASTLNLPLETKQVVVYLFSDEPTYERYLRANYPGLPPRRAYFIGTGDELAVYTFWGYQVQEDLRHEYTHGLLHASLPSVPLWLDEGLAEYFEVAGPAPGQINREYATKLATEVQNGWSPSLQRLEQLERVEQMQRADYRESWAWVHFLLHSSPESKQVLLDHLQSLRRGDSGELLSHRAKSKLRHPERDLREYVATLSTTAAVIRASSSR